MRPDDTYRPLSNGHEHCMFLATNCEGCRSYNPDASSSRNGCPMEVALALAACTDGKIKAKHGLRCGLAEAQGGEIVPLSYGGGRVCPERRGRDEPDDRPRRCPRPPAGQMDLLDPRTQPVREEVARAS